MRVSLEGVSLRYPGRRGRALDEVSLSIDRGERVALMGASGSGKSSLLRVIAGLIEPDGGRVLIDGADARGSAPPERGIGMVLQEAPIYEHLSVLDNVAHPLLSRGAARSDARREAEKLLDRMGLSPLSDARGAAISGGERRRAALARALATRPAVLLLDEPFSSLDPPLRLALREEVRRLAAEYDCACIHATHDGLEALALGTRVVVVDAGRIVDDAPPLEAWLRPRSPRSAVLLGAWPMNLLGDGRGVRPEHVRVELEAGATAAAKTGAGDSALSRADAAPPGSAWSDRGTIESIDPVGDGAIASVRCGEAGQTTIIRAMIDARQVGALAPGAAVRLGADPGRVHRFTGSPANR